MDLNQLAALVSAAGGLAGLAAFVRIILAGRSEANKTEAQEIGRAHV